MAANIHGSCVKCGKTGGVLFCNGCQQTLCFKHVNEHRDELEKQLEDLISQENQFENDLAKRDDSHYLFNDIDQWKKETIEQVKQIAKQAKQDLRQLIDQSNENLLKSCEKLKENIRLLKESEDLSEIQLNKLSNELNNLKKEINTYQLIKSSNQIFLKIEKQEINEASQSKLPSNENLLPNMEQSHSKGQGKGSISIREVDRYGHFIIIEHNGLTTDKEQDMVGWMFKRSIDSYTDIVYRFPNDFSLKSKSFVKILSRQASKGRYSYEKNNVLVAEYILTWGTGVKTIINRLIDANGDERDVLTQTF
ncbi:unnamed protein product [Rotaria sp. Silwood1]|nr:unnamed protein product [Rotaria sp. Silwood1]CAF1527977.1 unnamed protein product [Rotaria sp. Silwood1]CAF3807978.1 unnamed protein product [Rotaria sp. Silwood1]CAF4989977.1 unnamed protein product [Rotaria sp. Silwood1]